MPTYRKTRRADEDLQELYRDTRRTWGRDQAVRYLHGLEQRFIALAGNPLASTAREDLQPEGLRSVVHGSHVIFYQPQLARRVPSGLKTTESTAPCKTCASCPDATAQSRIITSTTQAKNTLSGLKAWG